MKHFTDQAFWEAYQRLPEEVRNQADIAYQRLKFDASYPSLHFKKAGRFWSARINRDYRALAVRDGEDFVWFWIGTHADYDKLLR